MENKNTSSATSFFQLFSSVKELFFLNCKYYKTETRSLFFSLNYFKNQSFRKAYLLLLWRYLFRSPFLIAKEESDKTKKHYLSIYGETPLPTFAEIAEKIGLNPKDSFIDLGSGRGLICFWAATIVGCDTTGIECIEELVSHAEQIARHGKIDNLKFYRQDIKEADLSKCTFLYFYGLHLPDEEIAALQERLQTLPSQAKVVSISFPLAQGKEFSLYKRFTASFPWGTTDIFCQVKR